MPAKVKVRILAGRNLPVMDKSSDASDAFVEVKLGNTTFKTEVYRRSLNPFWNSEWFRFELNDQELQDEPLQIRIMDYDTYSANDAIGKVYINLNPIIVNPARSMRGWLPIYDTLHGIRGEINCIVKVNLFADNNRYRHSSCGVRFFFSDIPNGYCCDAILGFVDELLVNDDPEYQWIDKIRTPRASNEARQTLFTKLSGEVQRKLGLKAEVFGGNAVIGYNQSFDLEGGSGIVGRGFGTAVILRKIRVEDDRGTIAERRGNSRYSQSTRIPKNPQERQLVHSVSADFFFEVPSLKKFEKRLSTAFENPKLKPSRSRSKDDLDSAESDYEDCSEVLREHESFESSDSPSIDEPISAASAVTFNQIISKRSKSVRITELTDVKSDHFSSSSRKQLKLNASSLIAKLKHKNDSISNKIYSMPIAKPSQLIKMLSLKSKNTKPQNPADGQDASKKVLAKSSSDEPTSHGQQLTHQRSSTSSKSQSPCPSPAPPTGDSSESLEKRRIRNKSVSGEQPEETLSIIEEKVDDDESVSSRLQQPDKGIRSRLASTSSTKLRQITRTSEVDLTDADIEASQMRPGTSKKVSVSSVEENPADYSIISSNPSLSASLSTVAKSPDAMSSESVNVVPSSPGSQSVLTDDTIKPNKSPAKSQLSAPSPSKGSIRRSDTDLAKDQRQKSAQTPESSSAQIKRSNSDLKQSNMSPAASNFAQSVRLIKAQQQLLQNMIKHQNQGLLVSSMNKAARNAFLYPSRVHESEYPFVTLKKFAKGMIQCTGGVVSVHSVKLLDQIINDEESETRDIWWTELRKEIRSHAKALNCNSIVGYNETSKIIGDVCILSASGTAAVLDPAENAPDISPSAQKSIGGGSDVLRVPQMTSGSPPPALASMPRPERDSAEQSIISPKERQSIGTTTYKAIKNQLAAYQRDDPTTHRLEQPIDCSFCHTPLICGVSMDQLTTCSICKLHKVPDVLLLTIEPPGNLNVASAASLVQARVYRLKRDSHGEAGAKEIGEALPFLEYELHRQLFSKLKFKGMNCLYNLTIDISIGENIITGIATGTGCYVLGLPTPQAPQISAGKGIKPSKLTEIQRLITLSAEKNRENLGVSTIESHLAAYIEQTNTLIRKHELGDRASPISGLTNPTQDSFGTPGPSVEARKESFVSETTPRSKSKHHHHRHHRHHHHKSSSKRHQRVKDERVDDLERILTDESSIVLEVDDNEDADIIALLIDSDVPNGYFICNGEAIPITESAPVSSISMFTQVTRSKLASMDQFAQQFDSILQGLYVKLRRSIPCCVANLSFFVDLPESHIVQITVTGCLVSLRQESSGSLTNNGQRDSNEPDSSTRSFNKLVSSNDESGKPANKQSSTSMSPRSTSYYSNSSSSLDSTSGSGARSSSSTNSSDQPTLRSSSGDSAHTSQETQKPVITPNTTVKSGDLQVPSTSKAGELSIPGDSSKTSLTKQLSKTNLVALLNAGMNSFSASSDKKKSAKDDPIELQETSGKENKPESTKDTIVAIRESVQMSRLGAKPAEPARRGVRAVFKKQRSYPGATSPAISGQDVLLPPEHSQSSAATTAKKASMLLNRVVKQPLKELGSNFNSQQVKSQKNGSTSSSSKTGRHSKMSHSNTASGGSDSLLMPIAGPSGLNLPMSPILTKVPSKKGPRNLPSVAPASDIDITSLSFIPNAKTYLYLGNLSFSFVRETSSVRENGGLNGFIHSFIMEVYAIVRAHVSALGGNAFLSFQMQQSCNFYHSNKNQAQCLISVSGDAAQVSLNKTKPVNESS